MNLDELRTVQSKERSKDSLQHLRESFYSDVADYVADLRERRDSAAEQTDDPFADPEVSRLTDEIQTAEEVVEGIYERRVGKVVKRASLAAMGVSADAEGLTSEEERLFEELVERIETNKAEVLDVLAGDETTETDVTATPDPVPTAGDAPTPSEASNSSAESDVSAADVMGGGGSESANSPASSETAPPGEASADANAPSEDDADGPRPSAEAAAIADASTDESSPDSGAADREAEDAESPDDAADSLAGLDERTTVRVTDDVGEIFGVDERTYDLASEDVVTLPEANAEPLVERGAAEKLD